MSQTPEMSMSLAAAGVPGDKSDQEGLFDSIVAQYAAPMARLARAHESDAALQQDLLQEIYIALWRSLPAFKNRCSLRTWIYRVAHNVAATHVLRAKRRRTSQLVNLDDVEIADEGPEVGAGLDEARAMARITELIQRLKPIDREVIILHLEGLSRDDIAEIMGLTFSNVAIKIHRVKQLLARSFGQEEKS